MDLLKIINYKTILLGSIVLISFLIVRALYLLYRVKSGFTKFSLKKRNSPVQTLICIGSGGHTTEMIKLITSLNPENYKPRCYIMSNDDIVSESKINDLELNIYKSRDPNLYSIIKIPRSRFVGQSYFTAIFSTFHTMLCSIPIVIKEKPELILCNGPGTCIPVCLTGFFMKILFMNDTRIVFVESICRVESFSLSGKILMCIADNIIVHWEELKKIYKRADYLGQLF